MSVFRSFFHGKITGFEITCLKSFVSFGHQVVLYSYDPIKIPGNYFEVADAATVISKDLLFSHKTGPHAGSFAGFSDLFRYALCEMFGDWWIDTDVVCLKAAWPDEKKFVAAWERGDYVNGAVLRLDKYSAESLKQRALALGAEVEFAQIGPHLITNFVHEESKEDLVLPQSAFYPISPPHWQRFYQEEFCYDIWTKARESLAGAVSEVVGI